MIRQAVQQNGYDITRDITIEAYQVLSGVAQEYMEKHCKAKDDGTGVVSIEAYQELSKLAQEYMEKYYEATYERDLYRWRAKSRKNKLKNIAAPMINELKKQLEEIKNA